MDGWKNEWIYLVTLGKCDITHTHTHTHTERERERESINTQILKIYCGLDG